MIASEGSVLDCHRGHEMMGRVVGTGCMAASAIGCFAAVTDDYQEPAFQTMCYYGACGERATGRAGTPVAFKQLLLDQLGSA